MEKLVRYEIANKTGICRQQCHTCTCLARILRHAKEAGIIVEKRSKGEPTFLVPAAKNTDILRLLLSQNI